MLTNIQTKNEGILFSLMFGIVVAAQTIGNAFPLAKGGAPAAHIVVAQDAVEPAKGNAVAQKVATAAHELQAYVKKLSGAELPIVSDETSPPGPLVLVGRSALTDAARIEIPAGLTPDRKEEGFTIVCKGDRLALAGNDAGPYHGTEYAVYDLLERLGVRWFMPGDFGEVLPSPSKALDVDEIAVHETPDFIQRNWWNSLPGEMNGQERLWKLRNKLNPDAMFPFPADSSIRKYVADPLIAATRPDLFAKNADGTINTAMPNLSSPEAMKIAAEKMIQNLREHPEDPQAGGISPDDGYPRDYSPGTLSRNQGLAEIGGREGIAGDLSVTDEWIEFVNGIAGEVNKTIPGQVVSTNGYANRQTPPLLTTPAKNMSIMFAAIWSDTLHAYDDPGSWQALRQGQALRQWCGLSDKVWVYGFNHTMLVSAFTPVPLTRKLARDFPLMKKWGVAGFLDEARPVWAESGIATKYLRARLEWNVHASAKAVLDDYFARWYGPAAEPIRAFWDCIEKHIEQSPLLGHEDRILPYIYSAEMMTEIEKQIQTAEARTAELKPEDAFRIHVKIDRAIYEHLSAYVAMSAAEFAGDFAEAAKQADRMLELRKAVAATSPFLLPATEELHYQPGTFVSWGAYQRRNYYQKLASMTGGEAGERIALLPEAARFRTDPNDEGRFALWHQPAWDDREWKTVLTTKPFYAQGFMSPEGFPFMGAIWYRFGFGVPASAPGKHVHLYAPVVETEAWCWVNGKYVGHRPYREAYERPNEMDFDVTAALKPGENNLVAIRVETGFGRAQAAGGFSSRLFLYSPKATSGAHDKPAAPGEDLPSLK